MAALLIILGILKPTFDRRAQAIISQFERRSGRVTTPTTAWAGMASHR